MFESRPNDRVYERARKTERRVRVRASARRLNERELVKSERHGANECYRSRARASSKAKRTKIERANSIKLRETRGAYAMVGTKRMTLIGRRLRNERKLTRARDHGRTKVTHAKRASTWDRTRTQSSGRGKGNEEFATERATRAKRTRQRRSERPERERRETLRNPQKRSPDAANR